VLVSFFLFIYSCGLQHALKANFIYSDLNPCGGGERFTLVTMQAVLEMGIDIEFTTLEEPNVTKLENAYGKDLASIIASAKKINVLSVFDEESITNNMKNGNDIVINTHGDIDPYYNSSLSKSNSITYCHFPSAKYFIQSEDKAYLEKHLKIGRMLSLSSNSTTIDNTEKNDAHQNIDDFNKKQYLNWLKCAYDGLMRNSAILTNSEYSKKAIFDAYGMDDAIVLSPPVEVDTFRNSALLSPNGDNERENVILVVSRIDPSKNIENAINFAKLLKENKIGKGMIIAGSLDHYFDGYYNKLKEMIMDLKLFDYVTFEINVSLDKLVSFMKKSKVYFHPRVGEHFGMSIVEAMSAGLIPIVPDIGGQTEFVPPRYHYSVLQKATQIASSAFGVPYSERVQISNSVNGFSTLNYKRHFQQIICKLL
jgi:glycosyltransferase involved in cell wall biosynthesis